MKLKPWQARAIYNRIMEQPYMQGVGLVEAPSRLSDPEEYIGDTGAVRSTKQAHWRAARLLATIVEGLLLDSEFPRSVLGTQAKPRKVTRQQRKPRKGKRA